jgi:hypothetical protein
MRAGCPVCTQRRAAGINELWMLAASTSRSPSFRNPPAPPRNDTNPTTAPTRSANVYYGRIVVFGTVGCKARLGRFRYR